MRENKPFLCLFPLLLASFLIPVFIPQNGETISLKTTLDSKYVRTDFIERDNKSLTHEYNPRLLLQYSYPITEWTDLSAEGRFNYKKEDKKPEEDTETKEPQIELRLKSSIYDVKTGYKETWTRNQTENRIFGHILIQPLILPELRVNYDHDETKNQDKKDKLTIRSIYKLTNSLKIKFDFKHEYRTYDEPDPNSKNISPDNEFLNIGGEIEFKRSLTSRRSVNVEVSYKFESLYEEEKDSNQTVDKDELAHILRGKLSYSPNNKTNVSLEYESKIKDDHLKGNDNSDQELQLNLSQKFSDWLITTGRIRKEDKQEYSNTETDELKDSEKLVVLGEVKATLSDWLQPTLKAIYEETEQSDLKSIPEKGDKTIIEGSLKSDFPSLLRSYQIIDFNRTHEDKEESPFSEDERLVWRWSMNPVHNLILKPEYTYSKTKNIREEERDITNEYKFTVDYLFNLNDYLNLNFSHKTSTKRIKRSYKQLDQELINDPNSTSEEIVQGRIRREIDKEINNDSSLEIDFNPIQSLFITSRIDRKEYRIEREIPSEEMAYSINFEWTFTPFTWSTSYKYNDKQQANDTETFESKLIYDNSDYMIEGEYKFTQTFMKEKKKEDVVTLHFKLVF